MTSFAVASSSTVLAVALVSSTSYRPIHGGIYVGEPTAVVHTVNYPYYLLGPMNGHQSTVQLLIQALWRCGPPLTATLLQVCP